LGVFAAFAFHEANGLRLAHAAAFVLFPSCGQAGREFQPNRFSTHDGAHSHGGKLVSPAQADKRVLRPYPLNALLIEVHPNPAEAWSDGAQQLTLEGFAKLMEELKPFIAAAGRE